MGSLLAVFWTWYLTAGNESEIKRVRRERIRAERDGGVFLGDDVRIFGEMERE